MLFLYTLCLKPCHYVFSNNKLNKNILFIILFVSFIIQTVDRYFIYYRCSWKIKKCFFSDLFFKTHCVSRFRYCYKSFRRRVHGQNAAANFFCIPFNITVSVCVFPYQNGHCMGFSELTDRLFSW